LVAGFNKTSSFESKGTPNTGLVRSTDGGDTWTQLGRVEFDGLGVTAVAARGNVIVVGTSGLRSGVWRSTDTGQTFFRISADTASEGTGIFGLPVGTVYDLVGDPGNPGRLFVAID